MRMVQAECRGRLAGRNLRRIEQSESLAGRGHDRILVGPESSEFRREAEGRVRLEPLRFFGGSLNPFHERTKRPLGCGRSPSHVLGVPGVFGVFGVFGVLGLSTLGLAGCGEAHPAPSEVRRPAATAAGMRLVDEAYARGLDHVNHSGGAAKEHVLEANGAGVAALDLASDGDLDLVFAQGLESFGALLSGPGADLEVFENDGGGTFSRVPGPGLSGWWTGLAAGDVDGDGDTDLVAGGFGALRVLLQEDGRLRPGADLMPAAGRLVPGEERAAGRPPLWVTSLALLDADRDGALDLYVGHYLELDPVDPPRGSLGQGPLAVPCRWKGHDVFCGPHGMVPQADRFLRGNGDGTFEDETSERLPGHAAAYTLGVATLDADGDGDADLYVANDSVANHLLINDGEGRFTEVGWSAGVALSSDGRAEAGMGIAVGDVDRDGRLDLAVTNFSGEPTELYLGLDFGFEAGTHRFGMQRASRHLLSWGAHLLDVDGDGWQELFTGNGHVYPQADLSGTGTSYGQADTLWRLGKSARAERVEPGGPDSLLAPETGTRGSAVGDFDGDGAPDLALSRIDGPAALGMNQSGPAGRLVVRCVDARGADVIGARAVVAAWIGGVQVGLAREVRTAVGYQSASAPWLFFGLGDAERFDRLVVSWPSGETETIAGGPVGRFLTVREGAGVVAEEALR